MRDRFRQKSQSINIEETGNGSSRVKFLAHSPYSNKKDIKIKLALKSNDTLNFNNSTHRNGESHHHYKEYKTFLKK